jgi:mono/diheme cytochrome c family protein
MRHASAAALVLVLAAALPAQAQDARRGRQLYETHCLSCHYEHVHDRAPGRSVVKSLEQLREEVAGRAKLVQQVRLTQEDLDDIVAYLDQSHYHFSQ